MSTTTLATSSNSTIDKIWGDDDGASSQRSTPHSPKEVNTRGSTVSPQRRVSRSTRLFFSDEESDGEPKGKGRDKSSLPSLDPEIEALFPSDDLADESWMRDNPPSNAKANEDLEQDYPTRKSTSKSLEQLTKEAEERHAKTLAAASTQRKQLQGKAPTQAPGSSSSTKKALSGTANKQSNDAPTPPDGEAANDAAASAKNEKKRKKTLPKLDENRLLGPNGFVALIEASKRFKSKGKGHETTDLARALEMYQLWTHQLYPKTQFRDTADRVEKLCRSRRMMMSLSVWRDEAKNGPSKPRDTTPPDEPIDLSQDEDADEGNVDPATEAGASSPRSSRPDQLSSSKPSGHEPQKKTSTVPTKGIDEFDYDIMMAEEFEEQQQKQKSLADDDFWGDIDEVMRASAAKPSEPSLTLSKPSNSEPAVVNDEEALWRDMAGDDDALAAFMENGEMSFPVSTGPVSHSMLAEDVVMCGTSDAIATKLQISSTSDTVPASTGEDGQDHSMDDITEEDLKKREAMRKEFEEGWDDMYA